MMSTTQTFPFGGSYVSGRNPMTTRGSYAGSSGTAMLGSYGPTTIEQGRPLGRYTDTASRRDARGAGSIRTASGSFRRPDSPRPRSGDPRNVEPASLSEVGRLAGSTRTKRAGSRRQRHSGFPCRFSRRASNPVSQLRFRRCLMRARSPLSQLSLPFLARAGNT